MADSNQNGYTLIDAPVIEYSSVVDILAWIGELEALPVRPEVDDALEEARKMLDIARREGG